LLSQQESAQLTSMTSLAADIDPAVEKAIRRCLDPDPLKRPSSALAVAASLPGGDPLAAALAAGETPSPELVAAAGKTDGMELRYSIPCFLVVLASVCAVPAIRQHGSTFMHGSLDYPPEVLAQKGRDIAVVMGYPKKPADTNLALEHRGPLVQFLQAKPEPREWDQWLASEAPIMALYRESQSPLEASPMGYVDENNPAPIEPGMVFVRVDGHGLLREFSAVPDEGESPAAPVEMDAVFHAAGLDLKTFTEMAPLLLPQHAVDQLRAWKGPHPTIPDMELTVEVATWKGRVTQAIVEFPWYRAAEPVAETRSLVLKVREILVRAAVGAAGFFSILLARRNWKKERVDKKGALRIATAYFALGLVAWIGRVHPVPNDDMFSLFYSFAGEAFLFAACVWLLYLALEPAVRSRWPHAIVTWNRVLAGRWNDAQVGSHILIGAAVGMGMWVTLYLVNREPRNELNVGIALWPLLGARSWVAAYALNMQDALVIGLLEFFAIFGLRVLLKKDWLAATAASLLFTAVVQNDVFGDPHWPQKLALYFVLYGVLMFVLLRVGLVTTIGALFFFNALNRVCLGSDFKAWWAPFGFATIFLLVTMASLALWRSLGTQEIAMRGTGNFER